MSNKNTKRSEINHDSVIYVVDDSSIMRKVITSMLVKLGYKNVFESDNGKNFIETIRKTNKVDLVFCDIDMPEKNGLDTLRETKSLLQFNDLPFIMVSADHANVRIMECIKSGAENYIIKPFDEKTFIKKLDITFQRMREKA